METGCRRARDGAGANIERGLNRGGWSLGQVRIELPKAEDLIPRLREKLRDISAALKAAPPLGRMALGSLLGDSRLRVYADGRIEGLATLNPETVAAPRRTSEPRQSVVAGGRYARVCRLPALELPVWGRAA